MPSVPKKSSTSKTSATTVPSTPVPPPPVPTPKPVAADTTTATKVTKPVKTKPSKTKAPVEPVVSTETTPIDTTVTPTANVVIANDTTASVTTNFSDFFTRFQKIAAEFSQLRSDLKLLEKRTLKDLKVSNKMNNKRKKKTNVRAPSGFVKPTRISDELASFLGKPFGSEMARTDVTREINAYIRAHNLQDKTNGRKIIPDTQLATLLKVTDQDELTYFNLQRFMSPHFTKKAQLDAEAAAASSSA